MKQISRQLVACVAVFGATVLMPIGAQADGYGAAGGAGGMETPVGTLETLLEPNTLIGSLRNMTTLFPSRTVARGGPIRPLEAAPGRDVRYAYEGADYTVEDFMVRTRATGLLVLKDGQVITERYAHGATPGSLLTSWSVAKSFTSTLVGIALKKGLIDSLDDPFGKYIPALKDKAYGAVSIRHALQMSSGIKFNERYGDGDSDVNKLFTGGMITYETRLNDYMAARPQAEEPGTRFNYSTGETQIIGWLVQAVSGQTVSDFMSRELWQKLGAEHDAQWLVDQRGGDAMEMTGCCLNISLRDYARFGLLMAQDGMWEGERLLPEGWVAEATQPQSAQVAHGALDPEGVYPLGYGYQWWSLPGPDKAFTAQGVYGQFVYVNPAKGVVAALTSAWPEAWMRRREFEFYAFMEAFEAL
ncbi:MAG: serine hydrolase domain-containing protein [Alphaproteobacteria bacterium]